MKEGKLNFGTKIEERRLVLITDWREEMIDLTGKWLSKCHHWILKRVDQQHWEEQESTNLYKPWVLCPNQMRKGWERDWEVEIQGVSGLNEEDEEA